MRKFWLVLLALTAAFVIAPPASADSFYYAINGQNFSADLTFTATPIAGYSGDYTITGVTGWFSDPDTGLVNLSSSNPATVISAGNVIPASGGSQPTYANNGSFQYDNVLYANLTGNRILDWEGLLFSIDNGSYELNIFSDSTYDAAGYFYWADNGSYYSDNSITIDPSGSLIAAPGDLTTAPEPGSLLLLGTGLLDLAAVIFLKAKPSGLDLNS
jgi:hypothetical protein